MRVTIRQKHIENTPALAEYIDTKLVKRVERLLKGVGEKELPVFELECARTTRHHRKGMVYRMEANLSIGGVLLRAAVDDEDMRAACDLLEEELEREILSFKNRRTAVEKRNARRFKKDLRLDPAARFYRKGRIREEGI